MFKSSIFDSTWINLVFEGRNKEYGAYQLRKENKKTTLKALALTITIVCLPIILFSFKPKQNMASNNLSEITYDSIIKITDITYKIEKEDLQQQKLIKKSNESSKTKNLINNKIVSENEINIDDFAIDLQSTNGDNNENNSGHPDGSENGFSEGNSTNVDNYLTDTNNLNNNVYYENTVDIKPNFPGGMEKFYQYIVKNFKTKEDQDFNQIRMAVQFIIEADGSISNIQVIRNPGYGLDKEAIRILSNLKTKWIPGKT